MAVFPLLGFSCALVTSIHNRAMYQIKAFFKLIFMIKRESHFCWEIHFIIFSETTMLHPLDGMLFHYRLPPAFCQFLGGERHCESEVSCPRKQHNDPSQSQLNPNLSTRSPLYILTSAAVLCSWARHLTLTVPLATQEYKWVPATKCWDCDGLSYPTGGVAILLVSFMLLKPG